MDEINLLNQTNLRFYFYFALTYLCVEFVRKNNDNIIEKSYDDIFEYFN